MANYMVIYSTATPLGKSLAEGVQHFQEAYNKLKQVNLICSQITTPEEVEVQFGCDVGHNYGTDLTGILAGSVAALEALRNNMSRIDKGL